jgi:hypothetical protein
LSACQKIPEEVKDALSGFFFETLSNKVVEGGILDG